MDKTVIGFSGPRRGPTPDDRAKLIEFAERIAKMARQDNCMGISICLLMNDADVMVDWFTLPGSNRHETGRERDSLYER